MQSLEMRVPTHPSNCTQGVPLSWYNLYDYRWICKCTDIPFVAFHPESKGIIIYIFPKDGSGKGTVPNINHDIVPQVIGKTLAWVSHDKEDKIRVM